MRNDTAVTSPVDVKHECWYEVMRAAEAKVASGRRAVSDDSRASYTLGVSYDDGDRDHVNMNSVKERTGPHLKWAVSAPSRRRAVDMLNCGASVADFDVHPDGCPTCVVRGVLES